MQRVQKSVLVPYSAARCSTWSTTSSAIRNSCPGAAARRRWRSPRTARPRASTSTITASSAHFTTDNVNRAARFDRRDAEGRSVSPLARRVAISRARATTRARSNSSSPTSSRRICSKRRRARVRPHRQHVHRRLRPPRRGRLRQAAMTGPTISVTVAYAAPGVEALIAVAVPEGATVNDAIVQSGIVARYCLDPAQLEAAIFGQRAQRGHAVRRRRSRRIDAAARRRSQTGARASAPRTSRIGKAGAPGDPRQRRSP